MSNRPGKDWLAEAGHLKPVHQELVCLFRPIRTIIRPIACRSVAFSLQMRLTPLALREICSNLQYRIWPLDLLRLSHGTHRPKRRSRLLRRPLIGLISLAASLIVLYPFLNDVVLGFVHVGHHTIDVFWRVTVQHEGDETPLMVKMGGTH
jgi:hypothetical protein